MADMEEGIVNSALAKAEQTPPKEEGEVVASSALEENILSKGKNAYYYAHADNLGKGGDKKNLGGAPRLLARTESKKSDSAPTWTNITKYAWADAEKKVSIYINDMEGLNECTDEQVELSTGKESMKLTIRDLNGENYMLDIPKLNGEISKGKFKLVPGKNRLLVTLFKVGDGFNWYDLKKE